MTDAPQFDLSEHLDAAAADWRHRRRRFTRAGEYARCPRCHTSPAYFRLRVAGVNDWTDAALCPECGHEYPIRYLEET